MATYLLVRRKILITFAKISVMHEEFTNVPFTFGTIILKTDFVNRQKEIKLLRQCFLSGTNVILISPRRWGKSSLVEKVAESFENNKTLKICKLDLFNVRTEEEFYISFTNAVLKATSSRWDDFVTNAKQFLSQLLPQVSLASNDETTLQFGISWKELQKNPDDILNLAENIAQKKGIKIVVCFDEFQNIASFSDSLSFQKKLRAHFQRHQNVSYCFYGSKRHMLIEVFTDTSMPFL
ncbi:ATP-binding protein [Capnocytophaga canimorsus]|nr:ATP-binding protein [Capnocytophaga canimorsus]WGU68942.1 ATP-binding protein [Capnocytophaga canimorsus]